MVYTFWEGMMPEYIRLCMKTWGFDYTVLNYENLKNYTDFDIERTKRFTLPQIADAVRVHVLRDNGGYWLDADTIMVKNILPTENMIGYPEERLQTIGYLHTEKNSEMFKAWAKYQDGVIANKDSSHKWSILGNSFTDNYVKLHPEISICSVENCWAETYMVEAIAPRASKYVHFYFDKCYHLKDLRETNMLMLHNSWTPEFYKKYTEEQVLNSNRTLSNILREVLKA